MVKRSNIMRRVVLWMAMFLVTAIPFVGCSKSTDRIMDTTVATTEESILNGKLELKVPDPVAKKGSKILFVGNSHTYVNDLPQIFYEMTIALGTECDVYDLTEGAYYLHQFADTEDEIGAILDEALTEEEWDFVILQENTNAAVSNTPEKDMLPYAEILDKKIKKANGQTGFLMTWAPKNGGSNGVFAISREKVQEILATNYSEVAKQVDGLLFPAGIAFLKMAEQYPEIQLWDEDEIHPSVAGSYLASCVIYAELFQKSPEGCSYIGGLDEEVAKKLQTMAKEIVLE